MYRLPGGRRTLRILEGPYTGAECVVQDIGADSIRYTATGLVAAFFAAEGWKAERDPLTALYDLFAREGQPTWSIADHRGVIPPTGAGMMRLPIALALEFIDQWVAPPSTAVDEIFPPGPLRDELNRELRTVEEGAGETRIAAAAGVPPIVVGLSEGLNRELRTVEE